MIGSENCRGSTVQLTGQAGERRPTSYAERRRIAAGLVGTELENAVGLLLGLRRRSVQRFVEAVKNGQAAKVIWHGNFGRLRGEYEEAYDLVQQAASGKYRRISSELLHRLMVKHGVQAPSARTLRFWRSRLGVRLRHRRRRMVGRAKARPGE